jgi:hypothetical protein
MVNSMNKVLLGKVFGVAALVAASSAPAFAIDYDAKPVKWVITSPFRLAGALTGAAVSGVVSGPVDDSYHWFLKGTQHVAGKFGDEKGRAQLAVGAPTGGAVGAVLGAGHGVVYGAAHGFKSGWEKPFSRWSYITMEKE